jgi:hypothetical protein
MVQDTKAIKKRDTRITDVVMGQSWRSDHTISFSLSVSYYASTNWYSFEG